MFGQSVFGGEDDTNQMSLEIEESEFYKYMDLAKKIGPRTSIEISHSRTKHMHFTSGLKGCPFDVLIKTTYKDGRPTKYEGWSHE